MVKEFEIEKSNNATPVNGTDESNKKNNSQIPATSMYTDTDLEETSSKNDHDGPLKNKDDVNNTKIRHGNENTETESNMYTDADLKETRSNEQKKQDDILDRDKKSAGSFLFVRRKRETGNTEPDEGSGEGSGNEML